MTWCDKSLSLLKTLWDDGHSASTIAREINAATGQNLSRSAIIGKRFRIGLPGRAHETKRGGSRRKIVKTWATDGLHNRPAYKEPAPTVMEYPPLVPDGAIEYEARRVELGLTALADLKDHHCRWPIGDPRSAEFGFCGATAVRAQPYCAHHTHRAAPEISSRPRPRPDHARPYTPTRSREIA